MNKLDSKKYMSKKSLSPGYTDQCNTFNFCDYNL